MSSLLLEIRYYLEEILFPLSHLPFPSPIPSPDSCTTSSYLLPQPSSHGFLIGSGLEHISSGHPGKMDELKRYIVHLPQSLGFREERKVKVNLFKALYYAITGEGKYMDLLFSDVPEDELVALKDYSWPPKLNRTRPFYKYVTPSGYSHPEGLTCGRVLKENESVYRCSDCGYDDTCVICVHCFNREDHVGHNVSVYQSRGDSGGMCDCGDEAAFLQKLNCACQKTDEEIQELPEEFKLLMRETLTVVLNYILDVANFSINTLPLIHENINRRGNLRVTSQTISDFCSLPFEVYGADDVNSEEWYLVLWNDENHDYLEAETGIRAATGVPDDKAKEIASEINANGRAILKVAKKYTDLLKGQKLAEVDGLVATIMSARDYMREVIVLNMFSWLIEVASFSGNAAFREASRALLAELFLEPGFEFSKVLPKSFFQAENLDVQREFFKNGLLMDGELVNLALTRLKPGITATSLMKKCSDIFRPALEQKVEYSRIQYLFAFEIRFVSAVRKKFTLLILPLFFTDPATKAQFCEQYIDIFPISITVLAVSDREDQLASITAVASQLFTCPRSNKWIVSSGKIGNMIGPLSALIETYASRVNSSGLPNLIDIVVDVRSKREKLSIQKTIDKAIECINHIMHKNDDSNILNEFLVHDNLMMLINLLKYFQGSLPIERKYGDHVERDMLEDFYTFLQRSLPVLSMVQSVSKVEVMNKALAVKAVVSIVEFLSMRKLNSSAHGIAEFRVSKEPVSFVNPINSFLSYILQDCGVENVSDDLKALVHPFMFVSDFSLRSLVLAAQVKIGFWIRNGVTVSRQASYYSDTIAEVSFFRDFFLNQVACVIDDPRETLLNFLDRWELLQWYTGEIKEDKTIYEERFGFICEQFILFLYNTLTDRFYFDEFECEEARVHRVKKAISYALCGEPKSYTALKSTLGSMAATRNFDDILYECADYSPPTGLYDSGIYRLKPSLCESLDPMSFLVDSSNYLSISASLISSIAKSKNIREKEVVLKPEIYRSRSSFVNDNIGEFTRTKEFAKLVYKLLQVALNSLDELFLPHLLHLIHAVILDDEQVHGKGHLVDFFVSIPISDLLLSIAESSMSSEIVLKADFLLDEFVTRDDRIMESLVDCFGEDHVQLYKKRKVGIFESESEKRKRLAEERKAAVMRKFAKQREKFMKQNDLKEDKQEEEERKEEEISNTRKCVACGEEESLDRVFGLLLCHTESSIFWKVPESTQYRDLAFGNLDARAKPEDGKLYAPGYPYQMMSKDNGILLSAVVGSSCAHGMHYKCYVRARTQLQTFPCPLCHNLHDSFIPSMLATNGTIPKKFLDGEPEIAKYNRILASCGGEKMNEISRSIFSKEYFDDNSFKEDFVKLAINTERTTSTEKKFRDLSVLIADSIRANEMTTRLDGTKGLSNFMEEIPMSSKAMLRSMIQTRIFLHSASETMMGDLQSVISKMVNITWDQSFYIDGQFNEVVLLFFQTSESLRTCMRLGYAKLVAVTAYALCRNFGSMLNGPPINSRSMDSLDDTTIGAMVVFLSSFEPNDDEDSESNEYSNHFACNLYFAMERLLLPFLRQCVILYDLLTCEVLGENEFKSVEGITNLKSRIESQSSKDSCDLLCDMLNLPTLADFLKGIVLDDPAFEFEAGILDVHFNAKIPSRLENGILNLQYPGVVRLIDLPDDYNDCITDPQYKSASGVDSICLQCGTYLNTLSHVSHMQWCSFMPIYFSPSSNMLNVVILIPNNPFEVKIPAPYLTVHGEVKRDRLPGKATLNHFRYNYLSKLWISQGLFGFVTRTFFGLRGNAPMVPNMDDIGAELEFDEDSDDDFGFWE